MWISEIIERSREALDLPVVAGADGDLVSEIEQCETAMRVLLAAQLKLVAEIERRGIPSGQGARSTKSWLQQRLRISGPDADARVKVARAVNDRTSPTGELLAPELPATAVALRAGAIGLDHARTVVTGLRKVTPVLSPQQCQQAEVLLVEQSRVLEPRGVQVLAERVRYHFDQDGAFREEERQYEDRELHFGVARDGTTILKGRLDRETGAKLRAVLEPLAAPRPEQNGDQDPRTPGQRNADALTAVLDIALATHRLPRAGGQRPHLTVTVSLDSLQQRLAHAPGAAGVLNTTGQSLTATQIRRIACDADVLPMVLGGQGQPLDVGRTQRSAPPHIRATLLARDGNCAFPECDQPPGTSEAHHIQSWVDGGQTSLANMTMLCSAHHRIVHNHRWGIEMANGRPIFRPPSTVDPRCRPRPGNRPLHQLDLTPLISA